MHHHRVRGRKIEAAFDNRRRQKHIVLAIVKGIHPIIELARRHLAVGDDVGHLWHLLFQPALHLWQIADARDNEKRLPATIVLAQERLSDRDRVELADVGAYGEAVDRRRADDR